MADTGERHHILTDWNLIETDQGPSYQYCESWFLGIDEEGCPGNMYLGEEVVLRPEDDGRGNESTAVMVYCLVCGTDKAKGEVINA